MPVLTDLKWHQVFFEYCSWFYQCYGLYGFNSSSDFHFLQSPFQAFGKCSMCANYNWYYHVPHSFHLSSKIQVFVYLFAFFHFHSGLLEQQNPLADKFFFFFFLIVFRIMIHLYDLPPSLTKLQANSRILWIF